MSSVPLVGQPIPCKQCGYDLRGTVIGGSCPECGLLVTASRNGLRVDGKRLVIRSDVILPPRCVKTNEPVDDQPITKTLYWAHPAVIALILVNLLVMALVYMIVRKRCRVTYFLSTAQRRKLRTRTMIGVGVLLAGIVAFCAGFAFDSDAMILAGIFGGIITFILGLILILVFQNAIAIVKHKDGEFWLKGCGPEFLESVRVTTTAG